MAGAFKMCRDSKFQSLDTTREDQFNKCGSTFNDVLIASLLVSECHALIKFLVPAFEKWM